MVAPLSAQEVEVVVPWAYLSMHTYISSLSPPPWQLRGGCLYSQVQV